MPLHPYLVFDGNAREAVQFYAKVFGAEEQPIMTYGSMASGPDAPPLPPGSEHLVMHTYLEIGGSKLMFSDNYPGAPFRQGNNFTIAYITHDEQAIRNAFQQLKEGGTVELELQEMPWSKCYGSLVDKFGIGWQFNLEQ